jgi:hypothetical protein
VVIDTEHYVIQYGDALGSPIPSSLLNTYKWWLSQHSDQDFTPVDLPISQQIDNYSCGMLSDNALHHYVDPKLYPLTKTSGIISGRLKTFNILVAHIQERVSPTSL